ncbi:group 10 secretory phospholipase A2 [Elgaria multicarinata webbii]|uniref:group 10 secretory phospholipase A2 n=1 Tax=Elgaria multicarinata webbii TaxID=159646 RepID=UPI002FCD2F2B
MAPTPWAKVTPPLVCDKAVPLHTQLHSCFVDKAMPCRHVCPVLGVSRESVALSSGEEDLGATGQPRPGLLLPCALAAAPFASRNVGAPSTSPGAQARLLKGEEEDPLGGLQQLPCPGRGGAGGHSPVEGNAPVRNRRNLLQLAGAILCTTRRSPLAYVRYGCYCGLGGSGWPRDPADWCCFQHDCCYGKAEEEQGCAPKTESYKWECEEDEAKCDDEDSCQKTICECDREAAKCLASAPYNATYLFWPENSCGKGSPQCEDD